MLQSARHNVALSLHHSHTLQKLMKQNIVQINRSNTLPNISGFATQDKTFTGQSQILKVQQKANQWSKNWDTDVDTRLHTRNISMNKTTLNIKYESCFKKYGHSIEDLNQNVKCNR